MGHRTPPFLRMVLPALAISAAAAGLFAQEIDWAKRVQDAQGLEASGKAAEALEAWKALVLELPEDREAMFHLAIGHAFDLLNAAGKYREAEDLMRSACEKRPGDSRSQAYLALAIWDRRVREAWELEAAGKPTEAIEAWKALVLEHPEVLVNRWGIAMDRAYELLSAAGKYREAEDLFRRACEKRPGDLISASYLALVLWAKRVQDAQELEASGKAAEALEAWKALVLELPAERAIKFRTAMDRAYALLHASGKYREIEDLFRRACEKRPDDAVSGSYLALVLQTLGKNAEAVERYRRLAAAGGSSGAWAATNLGLILARDEATEMEAADSFLAAVRADPSQVAAAEQADRIALVRVQRRRFDDCRRIWSGLADAPGLDPVRRARALLYLEMIEFQLGRLDEAESLARRAIELAPGDPELVNNLALVRLSRGDEKGALETLDRALALDPAFADALEVLGTYHLKRRRPEKAREFFLRGQASAAAGLARARAAAEEAGAAQSAALPRLEYELGRARYRLFRFEAHLRELAK